jgi:hypothetical protein
VKNEKEERKKKGTAENCPAMGFGFGMNLREEIQF